MCTNIILPVVSYGCKTWSLILSKKLRLRLCKNAVLKIFGSEKDEVTEKWRRQHNKKLYDLYCSQFIIRVIKSRRI
jgi:hypothetical protein